MEDPIPIQKKISWIKKLSVAFKLHQLRTRDQRWYPIPFVGKEHSLGKIFDQEEPLVANHPGSHDGVLFGVRFHAVKLLVTHGLWGQRDKVGVIQVETREAGPESGYWNLDTLYQFVWIE